jgi:hypothetical protein
VLCGVAALLGCDEVEPYPAGELVLTEGQETDTWTSEPVPVRAKVDRILEDGTRKQHARLPVPPERFSLGTDGVAIFELTGFDADEQRRVWGRSYPLDTPTLLGWELPLFVSRTGTFSRPPGNLEYSHGQFPPVALLGDRLVLVAGSPAEGMVYAEAYDLAFWNVYVAPELRCPSENELCEIRNLAVVDHAIIVALGDGWLRSYLLRPSEDSPLGVDVEFYDAALPDGLNEFSDVAGGQVVSAPDGDVYVVGATRPGSPSSAVLRLLPGEEDTPRVGLRVLRLGAGRATAAAAWVDEYGLVVVGGSADAPGIEVLAEGQTESAALPFPPDPTSGAAITKLGGSWLVRMGGTDENEQPAQTVALDLGCSEDCTAQPLAPPVELVSVEAFSLGDQDVLAIGLDPDGTTRAVRIRGEQTEEVALREARRGASALRVSTGHVALVGGLRDDDTSLRSFELFAP